MYIASFLGEHEGPKLEAPSATTTLNPHPTMGLVRRQGQFSLATITHQVSAHLVTKQFAPVLASTAPCVTTAANKRCFYAQR